MNSNSNNKAEAFKHFAYTLHLTLQTVALSQLDSLRRELIVCARDRLEFLVFTKVTQPCRNLSGVTIGVCYEAWLGAGRRA